MEQTKVLLNNGVSIPQVGLGAFCLDNAKEVCLKAIELGYRHIDTAHIYGNEKEIGEAIRECGVPRSELFVTSKIWPSEYGDAENAVGKILSRMGLDYLDLILLHQQTGKYVKAYKGLENLLKAGKVRAIGVSNFESKGRLEKLLGAAEVLPCVNQLECHPFRQQAEMKSRLGEKGIIIESWFPLGHGDKKLLEEPVILDLANKYGKTPVQIILRWHVQEGFVVFPKTSSEKHLRENLDVFDFSLSDDDVTWIRALDGKKKYNTMPLFLQGLFNWFQSVTILKKIDER